MRLQDFKLFEPTTIGTPKLYRKIDENLFFINSNCIQTTDKQILKDKTYLFFYESSYNKEIKIIPIKLLAVFLIENYINIIVRDLLTYEQILLKRILYDDSSPCHWFIVDIDYLQAKVKDVTIKN